jgi:hypothetical protein
MERFEHLPFQVSLAIGFWLKRTLLFDFFLLDIPGCPHKQVSVRFAHHFSVFLLPQRSTQLWFPLLCPSGSSRCFMGTIELIDVDIQASTILNVEILLLRQGCLTRSAYLAGLGLHFPNFECKFALHF